MFWRIVIRRKPRFAGITIPAGDADHVVGGLWFTLSY